MRSKSLYLMLHLISLVLQRNNRDIEEISFVIFLSYGQQKNQRSQQLAVGFRGVERLARSIIWNSACPGS